jgi:YVTN family beta-propeller protein
MDPTRHRSLSPNSLCARLGRAHLPLLVHRRKLIALGSALLAMIALLARGASAAEPPLVLEAKIPLGAVKGRIDHLAIDLARQRLFVAELGNDSVGIIDLKAGTVIDRVTGLTEPQGVGYFPPTDTLYIANASDGSVHLYRGEDFAPRGRIDLGKDADNVRVDAAHARVWVGYGSGALAAIDGASSRKTIDISLKAHPESFRLDPAGETIFANVPDAGEIAIVDVAAKRQRSAIETHGDRGNFPMALDVDRGRILAVFRRPPKLVAYDMASGRPVASAETCGDADDVFLDAKRGRVYVSCGEGVVAVHKAQSDYARLGHVPTARGARTSLWVPERDRLYVAIRATGAEPAAIWVFRPSP